ncbi:hypothetical protein [Streptomyces sp. NPDC048560]|uniref:hypothetical protein n=1 Tax=Streptomyces sp. NPDC048560 TaxID=3155488 RepID=UPI003418517A
MEDRTPQPTWRFSLPWGDLDVFADGRVPESLRSTAAVLARLEERFRPALLRFHRRPEGGAYAAVWPPDRPAPARVATGVARPDPRELEGVVLAEVRSLTCHVCAARFQAVYPDTGLPLFGGQLSAHRLVRGCPACGGGFATSRIQALALSPGELSPDRR